MSEDEFLALCALAVIAGVFAGLGWLAEMLEKREKRS